VEDTLTTTEGAVLGLVALGESSGYDLARLSAKSVGLIWTPSQSQIYKSLARLAVRELAQTREVEQKGRPDKAVYRITRRGTTALRNWLDEVEDEPANGRIVYPLKFFFSDFASPGTAEAQLAAYRRFLMRRLDRYEALQAGPRRFESEFPGHVLQHGIQRVNATLAWIDETTAALDSTGLQRARRRARAHKAEGRARQSR
jgi:PadR family transcriptional regulator, regulatory protein AphA